MDVSIYRGPPIQEVPYKRDAPVPELVALGLLELPSRAVSPDRWRYLWPALCGTSPASGSADPSSPASTTVFRLLHEALPQRLLVISNEDLCRSLRGLATLEGLYLPGSQAHCILPGCPPLDPDAISLGVPPNFTNGEKAPPLPPFEVKW